MIEVDNQYDFFKHVKIDDEGNLLVKIINSSGGTSNNYYTTAANLSGSTLHFDRTDQQDAYQVDLSSIAGSGSGLNLDAGSPRSILMSPNYECGLSDSIPVDTIDGGNV